MNRFDFYPGDYLRDTFDLTAEEHGAYCLLMIWYYANERPIPDNRAMSISRANQEITQSVLCRFFRKKHIIQDDGSGKIETHWFNERCDKEITKWVLVRKRAQDNGKKGGRPKGKKPRANPEQTQSKSQTKPRANPEQKLPSPSPSPSPKPSPKERAPRTRARQIPDDWNPNEKHDAMALELGVAVSAQAEQFRDYHKAKGSTMKDWDAAFRTWLRNSLKFGGAQTAKSKAESMHQRNLELLGLTGEDNGDRENDIKIPGDDISVVPRPVRGDHGD